MTITLNGKAVGSAPSSLWELRMLSGKSPLAIRSYHPDIGRGSIEHYSVSHRDADSGIERLGKKTVVERLCGWLDI